MNKLGELKWGKDNLAVWGGTLVREDWRVFLTQWDWQNDPMRWGVWEYVSEFEINDGQIPEEAKFPILERAELFGPSGHLRTRRDGETIYWNFVGETKIEIPDAYKKPEANYWTTHPDEKFRRNDEEKYMLLWGERVAGEDRWHDDRVAWASQRLKYPGIPQPKAKKKKDKMNQRAQASYWQFTRAGQVAFVWVTRLEEHKSKGE